MPSIAARRGRWKFSTYSIFQKPQNIYNSYMVKNTTYKVSGLIVSIAFIIPLFASAQTDSLSTQAQSLMSQIQSLQQQLQTLLQTNAPSSTPPRHDMMPPQGGNGIATTTRNTIGNVCPQITRDLRQGAQGTDVSQLQNMLASEGFMSASSTTGFFGPVTVRALGTFQKQFGITASSTGVLGSLTRAFIDNHCHPQGVGGMGSSTPPVMRGGESSSTRPDVQAGPMMPVGSTTPPFGDHRPWNTSSTTPVGPGFRIHPMNTGSSTSQIPCPQSSIQNSTGLAAVAAALFSPHAILPGMRGAPCDTGTSSSGQSQ